MGRTFSFISSTVCIPPLPSLPNSNVNHHHQKGIRRDVTSLDHIILSPSCNQLLVSQRRLSRNISSPNPGDPETCVRINVHFLVIED